MKKKDITILLVDDEPDILEIIRYNLTSEGYTIETAENGLEAIEQAKKVRPQLIIMDVMMPKMDGFEVCRKIRKKFSTPIIMLSARGESLDQIRGLDLGADDYISKPFEPRELVARIHSLFRSCF